MNYVVRLIDKTVEVLATSALVVSTSMILLNVFNRYVVLGWMRTGSENSELWAWIYEITDGLLSPISATTDEIPGLLLIWIAFLGAYLAYRKGGHISFDMVVEKLPRPCKRLVVVLTDASIMMFLLLLLMQSIRMIRVDGQTEIETAEIAQGWFMVIIPLSAGLLILALVMDIIKRLRDTKDPII
jgi:TRAP-type C4-dicarboxylate transport system permease small subunit